MSDYQKIKYTVSGFIAGIGVLFAIATVLLMPPEEMWRWILNSQSNVAKVEKALSNPSEQLANLEKINQELRNDLVNEKALNTKKYQALVDDNLQLPKSASDLQDKLENVENITAQLNKKNEVLTNDNLQLKKSTSDLQDKLENVENITAQLNKKNEVLKLRNDLVIEKALNTKKYQTLVDDNLQLPKSASDLQDKLENVENITAQLNKKNEVLTSKNKELESMVAAPREKTFDSPSELYNQSSGILQVGSTFVDLVTSATLGISEILYDNEAIGYVSLPGKKPENFNNISAGYIWTFEKLGKKYVLTLKKANYLDQNFSVEIREEVY